MDVKDSDSDGAPGNADVLVGFGGAHTDDKDVGVAGGLPGFPRSLEAKSIRGKKLRLKTAFGVEGNRNVPSPFL